MTNRQTLSHEEQKLFNKFKTLNLKVLVEGFNEDNKQLGVISRIYTKIIIFYKDAYHMLLSFHGCECDGHKSKVVSNENLFHLIIQFAASCATHLNHFSLVNRFWLFNVFHPYAAKQIELNMNKLVECNHERVYSRFYKGVKKLKCNISLDHLQQPSLHQPCTTYHTSYFKELIKIGRYFKRIARNSIEISLIIHMPNQKLIDTFLSVVCTSSSSKVDHSKPKTLVFKNALSIQCHIMNNVKIHKRVAIKHKYLINNNKHIASTAKISPKFLFQSQQCQTISLMLPKTENFLFYIPQTCRKLMVIDYITINNNNADIKNVHEVIFEAMQVQFVGNHCDINKCQKLRNWGAQARNVIKLFLKCLTNDMLHVASGMYKHLHANKAKVTMSLTDQHQMLNILDYMKKQPIYCTKIIIYIRNNNDINLLKALGSVQSFQKHVNEIIIHFSDSFLPANYWVLDQPETFTATNMFGFERIEKVQISSEYVNELCLIQLLEIFNDLNSYRMMCNSNSLNSNASCVQLVIEVECFMNASFYADHFTEDIDIEIDHNCGYDYRYRSKQFLTEQERNIYAIFRNIEQLLKHNSLQVLKLFLIVENARQFEDQQLCEMISYLHQISKSYAKVDIKSHHDFDDDTIKLHAAYTENH